MAAGLGLLRLPPAHFWSMTPRELGAALTSFVTKCKADAKASCDKSAAEKKLTGAAKKSFEKKCIEDAAGKA